MPLDLTIDTMKPEDVILPIFAVDTSNIILEFLGTGFFVGEESLFITALHNIEATTESLGVVHLGDLSHVFPASLRYVDRENDIAILNVPDYRPSKRLALAPDDDFLFNQVIICFEYGTTVHRGKTIEIGPATRLGNITRIIAHLDFFNRPIRHALELSFPALRGASGAPVLMNDDFTIVGMVVGNMSYHLMPAQIETITNTDGSVIGETQYMLPLAIAVNVNAIRGAITSALER